ncbi:DUF4288 domain-containing protein [Pedobacter puniceum]|jgi:hypothetical protein|uniref:DUF4288 domain-containing protein n=1 Tax=Pedobacter puniceum TaxID=2666136 RepID=A0A7K0FIW2_9SPHI|nr:DUF4288 domain-containing protein [Pedobacter puniceum]MRX45591.1 DUF4288 domain-containing protein [Pedobacter puniceum]
MKWFAVKLIFQIVNDNNKHFQFDEQLRLVQALSKEHALEMAHQVGLMAQENIISQNGHTLNWKFIAVTESEYVGEIEQGKEIHYHIEEPDNVELYLKRVEEKALNLKKITQENLIHF